MKKCYQCAMLNYADLEAFVAVIEETGFHGAAKRLALTQPAVSKRVKNLENLVGQPLIVRTSPPKPTPAGKRLLAHFYQVRLLEKSAWSEFMSQSDPEVPIPLPIALNSESLSTWFLDAVEETVRLKNIVIQITTDDQDLTAEHLRAGTVLGCVTSNGNFPAGCRSTPLGTMPYVCVATPAFRSKYFSRGINRETLRVAPAAIYGKDDSLHEIFLRKVIDDSGFTQPPYHFVPSPEALVEITRRGLAYSVLPEVSVKGELRDKKLIELFPRKRHELKLFWQTLDFTNPILDALTKAIQKKARALL